MTPGRTDREMGVVVTVDGTVVDCGMVGKREALRRVFGPMGDDQTVYFLTGNGEIAWWNGGSGGAESTVSWDEVPNAVLRGFGARVIPSKRFIDADDCLEAAAEWYADELRLEPWEVEARWVDRNDRDRIVVRVVGRDALEAIRGEQ